MFGGPGTGKGTQGTMLGHIPGFHHCASGDVFRNLDPQSEMGKLSFAYSSKGELVPDDLTLEIWAGAMHERIAHRHYKPDEQLLILDGIPRTVEQAELLSRYINVIKIIHLSCQDLEAMYKRLRGRALSQNRPDDADEQVIHRRWEVYQEQTLPVLQFYQPDLIADIDAMGTPAEVLRDVLMVVAPIQSKLLRDRSDAGE